MIADLLQALERVQTGGVGQGAAAQRHRALFFARCKRRLQRSRRAEVLSGPGVFSLSCDRRSRGRCDRAGLLAAALCDFMVCNEDATYRYTDAQTAFILRLPRRFCSANVSAPCRHRTFYTYRRPSRGKQLRTKGWTCSMVPGMRVEAYAEQLASRLATKSQEALRLLKQHLTRDLVGLVKELTQVEVAAAATEDRSDAVATNIASPAKYIHLDTPAESVLVIKFRVANKKVGVNDLVADLGVFLPTFIRSATTKPSCWSARIPIFFRERSQPLPRMSYWSFNAWWWSRRSRWLPRWRGMRKAMCGSSASFAMPVCTAKRGCTRLEPSGKARSWGKRRRPIFTHRFGNPAGKEILLTGADYSGVDLQQRVGALLVAEHDQVLPTAVQVAESGPSCPGPPWLPGRNKPRRPSRRKLAGCRLRLGGNRKTKHRSGCWPLCRHPLYFTQKWSQPPRTRKALWW